VKLPGAAESTAPHLFELTEARSAVAEPPRPATAFLLRLFMRV
jgi:hypothetical protein